MTAYVNDPRLAGVHGPRSAEIAGDYSPERNAENFLRAIESWRAMRGGLAGGK